MKVARQGGSLTLGILLTIFLLIILGVVYKTTTKNQSDQPAQTKQNASCDSLSLKLNGEEEVATVLCIKNGQESKLLDLYDMYMDHYHSYEENNGNLYLIRRIGYDGYPDETWSDELWVYLPNSESKKLYADKGLDFRVFPDGKIIAIFTNDYFKLLDQDGNLIKSYLADEVIANSQRSPIFGFHAWGTDSIWLENTLGPSLSGLVKVDTKTFTVTKYDLEDLPAGPEFTLNTAQESVAFTNFPAMFDVVTAENFKMSGTKINLWVYDLKTEQQTLIATTTAKPFNPSWKDSTTLEYDDPNGDGRLTKTIY